MGSCRECGLGKTIAEEENCSFFWMVVFLRATAAAATEFAKLEMLRAGLERDFDDKEDGREVGGGIELGDELPGA